MISTMLKDCKKGEYIKRTVDAKKVYIRGDYNRATKSFSLIDCDDCNHEIFVKANKAVFIGFTY